MVRFGSDRISILNGNIMKMFSSSLVVLFMSAAFARAGLLEQLGLTKPKSDTNQTSTVAMVALSQDQMVDGLKEALAKGVQNAVSQLGRDGGFLTNLDVKIPMPERLRTVERTLRALKQDKLADDFVRSMNSAPEKPVPEAAAVFSDTVKQMTISDAQSILTGTNNAATQYFRRVTETNLFARFYPVVTNATQQVGVTAFYKRMTAQASSGSSLGGLFGGKGLIKMDDMDIDKYVTGKALDGLFKMVAEEEKRIRENPVARTTDLLQKVFSATGK
jgi:Protein of unknown function (DUF4197)